MAMMNEWLVGVLCSTQTHWVVVHNINFALTFKFYFAFKNNLKNKLKNKIKLIFLKCLKYFFYAGFLKIQPSCFKWKEKF